MSERENHTRQIFESEVTTVAFVQYGPDGTTPVNAVIMYVCPLCGASIPVPLDERPDLVFPDWHIEDHLRVVRMEDQIDALTEEVRALNSDWVGQHMAVTHEAADDPRPHSRACGISCRGHGSACNANCPTCGGKEIGPPTPADFERWGHRG